MGKGEPSTKAEILFEEWDFDLSGSLNLDEMNGLLDMLIKISVRIIPAVSKESLRLIGEGFASDDLIQDYMTNAHDSKERVLNKLRKIMMGINSDISKKEFVDKIRRHNKLVTPSGIRAYFSETELAKMSS